MSNVHNLEDTLLLTCNLAVYQRLTQDVFGKGIGCIGSLNDGVKFKVMCAIVLHVLDFMESLQC